MVVLLHLFLLKTSENAFANNECPQIQKAPLKLQFQNDLHFEAGVFWGHL